MSNRMAFLESAAATRLLLAAPAVGVHWDEPSSLEDLTVGALSGHLLRSVTTVSTYLGEPPIGGFDHLADPADYLLSIDGLSSADGPDLASDLHRAIRHRAAHEAEGGQGEVLSRWDVAVEELSSRLATEPPTRVVRVLGGRTMLVDDYLVTRLIEMVVHGDDLAVSIGVETPAFPDAAWRRVIEALTEVAVRRHGALAVVRSMTRTERDTVRALRVL
jgi:hypothetical protein